MDRYLAHMAKKRAPAVAEAARLVDDDRFDEAEQTVLRVEDSIYAIVDIAAVYRKRLEQLVAHGDTAASKSRREAVFRRALDWAQRAYPEPHTAMEADQFDSGRAENRAQLVRILGYDPDESR
jgi:hypothetical protein